MSELINSKVLRLKRASELISSIIESPPATMIRRADESGCLSEFEFLCEEVRLWLDDDSYYEDVAWNMENE